mmetsp:Transcript_151426/g.289948  ORF Transcript_151426/g.289948 Transcript_151426/m.289948 type:complete len:104 (+) Transcript_151426:3-314(+)
MLLCRAACGDVLRDAPRDSDGLSIAAKQSKHSVLDVDRDGIPLPNLSQVLPLREEQIYPEFMVELHSDDPGGSQSHLDDIPAAPRYGATSERSLDLPGLEESP